MISPACTGRRGRIGVGLEITLEVLEDLLRPGGAAVRRVAIDHVRMAAVADGDPEPAGLDPLAVVVLHRHRRVVVLDDPGTEDLLQHQIDDRLEQIGDRGHPVAHRQPRQLDARALEDSLEAIERQVIGILADGDVSQQPRAWQALVDRLGEHVGDHDVGLAVLASVLGADGFEDDQPGGDEFELLADFLADAGAVGAAVGASALFGRDVVQDRHSGPARRQRLTSVALLLGRTRSGRRGRPYGRSGCRRRLGLLQDLPGEEQELGRVDPLPFGTVALAEELLELVLELLVEMDLLGERLQQLTDELMGRLQVVREWVREGDHTLYYVDGCSIVGALCSCR